jgi:hypothetical protein
MHNPRFGSPSSSSPPNIRYSAASRNSRMVHRALPPSNIHFLILLPMLTSRSLHNLSQLSILYPSTPSYPQSQSGPHTPTSPLPTPPNTPPSGSLHSFFFISISFFVHLVSILTCLRCSRIVLCCASEQRLSCADFPARNVQRLIISTVSYSVTLPLSYVVPFFPISHPTPSLAL